MRRSTNAWHAKNKNYHNDSMHEWAVRNKKYISFYRMHIYPELGLRKQCTKYGFSDDIFKALNKGGKHVDKELEKYQIKMNRG